MDDIDEGNLDEDEGGWDIDSLGVFGWWLEFEILGELSSVMTFWWVVVLRLISGLLIALDFEGFSFPPKKNLQRQVS